MQRSKNPISDYLCCRTWLFLVVAMTILSCSSKEMEEPLNVPLYSVDELDSILPELSAITTGVFDPPGFMEPYYLEPFPKGGYVAANDRTKNLIHLFDKTGTHLSTAGGEGRGPGEFLGTVRLHAGQDNHLYALDSRLLRITRFIVDRNGLSYVTSYSPTYEPGSWLHNIYVTEWGNFGIVRSNVDYSTGEDTFHLYKLDDTFNQTERLLEMPGNEKMSLGEWSHVDHMFGQKTLWDLDGEWFYFISTHSPVINKYNLQTGKQLTDKYFDLEERKITDENENHLMDFASNMISRFPEVKEKMEAVTTLPFFQEFFVHENNLYLLPFNVTRDERTEIIRVNEITDEVRYIDIPTNLRRIQAASGMIYGIEYTESGSLIQIVNLKE